MTNEKKMTKRDYFEQIKANYALTEDEIIFINHEIELLTKKSATERKPSSRQIENDSIKASILEQMVDGVNYSIGDILKNFEFDTEMSSQRVSALVSQLVADNKVLRTVDKRKAYFSIV